MKEIKFLFFKLKNRKYLGVNLIYSIFVLCKGNIKILLKVV